MTGRGKRSPGNGVEARSGRPLPGRCADEPGLRLHGEEHRQITHWAENYQRFRTPVFGDSAMRLDEAGWGVMFAPGVGPKVRKALRPLLELRESQAGSRFRKVELADGVEARAFLEDRGLAYGPAQPSTLPYYLLLVGDPARLDFAFQVRLDIQYAVGRLHLDEPADYRRWAEAVVRAESSADTSRQAVFWSTEIPGDPSTTELVRELVEPLHEDLRLWHDERRLGLCPAVRAPDGSKATLARLLHEEVPALLFTASHGMVFPDDPEERRERQGALLCEDWQPGSGPVPESAYFSAEDLTPSADLTGLIAVHFACFATGSSRLDPFEAGMVGAGRPQTDSAFLSRLSQRLLASGAQAVVGHVDRAFRSSFTWKKAGDQTGAFRSALRRLLAGQRLGRSMEELSNRYTELAADLSDQLARPPRRNTDSATQLDQLRQATIDARNVLVLGDPAVRIVGTEARLRRRAADAASRSSSRGPGRLHPGRSPGRSPSR